MQIGSFPGLCNLESDFPDEESLAHSFSGDKSVWTIAGNKE